MQFNFVHVVVYPLVNGMFRVQIKKKDQIPSFGPLVDGAVVSPQLLPMLVRATVINANRVVRNATTQNYVRPVQARHKLLRDIATRYRRELDFQGLMMELMPVQITPGYLAPEEEDTALAVPWELNYVDRREKQERAAPKAQQQRRPIKQPAKQAAVSKVPVKRAAPAKAAAAAPAPAVPQSAPPGTATSEESGGGPPKKKLPGAPPNKVLPQPVPPTGAAPTKRVPPGPAVDVVRRAELAKRGSSSVPSSPAEPARRAVPPQSAAGRGLPVSPRGSVPVADSPQGSPREGSVPVSPRRSNTLGSSAGPPKGQAPVPKK